MRIYYVIDNDVSRSAEGGRIRCDVTLRSNQMRIIDRDSNGARHTPNMAAVADAAFTQINVSLVRIIN